MVIILIKMPKLLEKACNWYQRVTPSLFAYCALNYFSLRTVSWHCEYCKALLKPCVLRTISKADLCLVYFCKEIRFVACTGYFILAVVVFCVCLRDSFHNVDNNIPCFMLLTIKCKLYAKIVRSVFYMPLLWCSNF